MSISSRIPRPFPRVMTVAALLVMTPFLVATPAISRAIDTPRNASIVYCSPGDVLRLTGSYSSTHGIKKAILRSDDRVLDTRDSDDAVDSSYDFGWSATDLGHYALDVAYLLGNNETVIARKLIVEVLAKPPVNVAGMIDRPLHDFTITASPLASTPFDMAHIAFSLDDKPLSPSRDNPNTFVVPVETETAGAHTLTYVATNSAGAMYFGPDLVFHIAERITLECPDQFQVKKLTDLMPVRVTVAEGIDLDEVMFYAVASNGSSFGDDTANTQDKLAKDGQPVGIAKKAPWGANLDLTSLFSGIYRISAVGISPNGEKYVSPSRPLTLWNDVGDRGDMDK